MIKKPEWIDRATVIFGSASRFEVMSWVAHRRNPTFFPAEMHNEGGRVSTQPGPVLAALASLGLVERVTHPNNRITLYRRLDSDLWEGVRMLSRVIGGPPFSGALDDGPPLDVGAVRSDLLALSERLRRDR